MEPLDDTLRRLKRERDEADRRYNDALTALDRALPAASPLPPLPIAIDDAELDAINRERGWETVAAPQGWSGWRARLAGFIWRVAAPSLQRQQQFNARLVDHLNRQAAAAREADARARELVARLQADLAGVAEFHARTIQYLQQVTAYIDTRDRDAASGALIVNAALSGLAENLDKRWESQTLREQRRERHAADLAAQQDELRTIVTLAQQATLAIRRELERLQPAGAAAVGAAVVPSAPVSTAPTFAGLDSYKYVGFEDQFRGSREAIRARLESYLPFFAGGADVLDVGCGRGEFLELLAGTGVSARGIDVNHEMVEVCRARGLDVTEADAVSYLSSIEDESLGGLFAAQVVEHLQPGYLLAFLDLAFRKLRPGSRLILETLNPACWVAFFDSYIRDITHVWPLHPDTLRYLVVASGFPRAEIEYRAPVAPEDRLQPIAAPGDAPPALADLAETFNANVDKLNSRLFTHRDYAVIGTR